MQTAFRLNDLNAAIAAEYAITYEALQKGLVATKPLSVVRLTELCELGEKMMRARRRTVDAHSAAYAWIRREKLDIILPELK